MISQCGFLVFGGPQMHGFLWVSFMIKQDTPLCLFGIVAIACAVCGIVYIYSICVHYFSRGGQSQSCFDVALNP